MVQIGSFFCLFLANANSRLKSKEPRMYSMREWIPSEVKDIQEKAAIDMAESMSRSAVPFSSPSKETMIVNTSFVFYPSKTSEKPSFMASVASLRKNKSQKPSRPPPILLIHGFDSSCLEFRRLAPLLHEKRDVYAVDILGWGFNDHNGATDCSPDAKLNHLREFIKNVIGGPCVIAGASLGGGIAIILATQSPELVEKVVLIDAQGFIDGKGPSKLPKFVARLGVNVLKSTPLRMYANKISYTDKQYASEDAMRVGRLHCMMNGWEDVNIDFLLSGGFMVSEKVSQVQQPTLVIWGTDDKILEPAYAQKFKEMMSDSSVVMIEQCGHVPHLEKPHVTAQEILKFLGDL